MPVYTSMGELNKAIKKRERAKRKAAKKERRKQHGDEGRPGKSKTKGLNDPPLVVACSQGDTDAVRNLLQAGVAVDQKNHFGRTGLFKAASAGFVDVCELLIEKKADLFLKDAKGYTAVDWARLSRQGATSNLLENAMAATLREYRAEFEADERKKALNWIWDHNETCSRKVDECLSKNDLAGCVDVLDNCPPRSDFDEACKLNGITRIHCTDVMTRHGWTPLTKAAALGDVERAAKIIAAKADVNLETKMGHTPLTWAASCGYREIVVQLNWNGAVLEQATQKENKTALMHAARKGHAEVCAYILDRLVEQAQARVLEDQARCQAIQEILQRQAVIQEQRTKNRATSKELTHRPASSSSSDNTEEKNETLEEEEEPELTALDVANLQNELKTALGKDWVTHLESMLNMTDKFGSTALDHALQQGHADVVALLETQINRCQEHRTRDEEEQKNARPVECRRKCGFIDRADAIGYHEEVTCPLQKVSCTSNCGKTMLQGELDEHLRSECSRRIVLCENSYFGCRVKLPEFKREEHQEFHCKFRPVECRLGCGDPLRYHQRATHEQEECTRRIVPCSNCGEEMQVRVLKTHARTTCPYRMVPCPLKCNQTMMAKDVDHHVKHVCIRPCKWCAEMIGPELKRRYHEEYLCMKRISECGQRCGITNLVEEDRLHHESELCGNRIVQCTAGCGEWIFYGDQHNHIDPDCGDCARRLVRCPYDLANNKRIRIRSRGSWISGSIVHWKKKKKLFKILFDNQKTNETDISWQPLEDILYYPLQGSDWACGKFSSEDVEHHVNHECVLRTVKCKNGCGQKMTFKNLASHLRKSCPLRSVECPLGCGALTNLTGQASHVANECPKRIVECICGEEIVAEMMAEHEVENCVYTWTQCSYGCGTSVQKYKLADHLENHCPKRNVPCDLMCGLVLWAEEMESHYIEDCLHREVPCKLGCGEKGIMFKDIEMHENVECLNRRVLCPVECGESVVFSKLQEHLRFYCPNSEVPCPLGCGLKVLRSSLPEHEAETCERRQVLCPAGCKMWVTHNRIAQHSANHCDLGVISCPFGCGERLRRGNLPDHELICSCRIVPCGGCFDGCKRQVRSWLIDSPAQAEANAVKPGSIIDANEVQDTQEVAAHSQVLVYCESHSETALTYAAISGDLPLLLSILDRLDPQYPSQGIDFVTMNGSTALIYACREGHMKCAEALIDAGADINFETSHGATPLLEAIRCGKVQVCKMLIERRVNVAKANSQRLTPLVAARRTGLGDVVSLIYAYTRLFQQQRKLFQHIALGRFAEIQKMLQHGAPHELNIVDKLQRRLEKLRKENEVVKEAIAEIQDDTFEAETHFRAFSDDIREKEKGARKLQAEASKLESETHRFDTDIVPYYKKQLRSLQEIRENHVVEVQRIYEPPAFIRKTFTALLMLLGIEPAKVKDRRDMGRSFVDDWWGPARDCLSKHDFIRGIQLFNFAEVPDEVIAEIRERFVAPGGGDIPLPRDDDEEADAEDKNSDENGMSAEDRAFLRGDDSKGRRKAAGPIVPHIRPPPVPGIPKVSPAPPDAEDALAASSNDLGGADPSKRVGQSRDEKWGYRAGMDGYPLIEALQLYLTYVCKHREFEIRRREIAARVTELKSEQSQIMASLWPDHAAYKRAEFRHVMLSEKYEELTKRRRAIEFATDRASKRFEVSLLLNSRTATGHTALSFAATFNNSSVVHLLIKYGSCINYEDCINNAAASLIQTVFRHFSWKLHRKPWTSQNAPRYRLQESLTWRRIRGLYQQFEFLRETGRIPIIDAFYAGSQNCIETLLSRKANLACTSYTFPLQAFPMSIPAAILSSPSPVLAWHCPKTRPAMRGKIDAMHAQTEEMEKDIRDLRENNIQEYRKHKAQAAITRKSVLSVQEEFVAKKKIATDARAALEEHRKAMFELVLTKSAQQKMEEDLKARENTVRELEETAKASKQAFRLAKQAYDALRAQHKSTQRSAAAELKRRRRALRQHTRTLASRVAALEPFNVLTAAKAAVDHLGTLGFVRGDGWVRREKHQQAYEFAQEIWTSFEAERLRQRDILLGIKEVHRRGELQKKLNAEMSEAILANDYDCVVRCLDEGAHADHEPEHGYTPLIMAAERDIKCHNKDGEIVQAVCVLLDREERQAQVGRESRKLGYTALTRAAHKGKTSAMEQLLRRGANPNYVTRFGRTRGTTALIVAARNGKADAVRLLLEWGADPRATDADGVVAISAARDKNFTTACRELCFHDMSFSGKVQSEFKVAHVKNFCQWGCGKVLASDEIEEHESEDCPKAIVPCPNGCSSQDIWRSKLGEHLASQCDKREVKCKFCQTKLLSEEMGAHHANACPFRNISCLMCGEEMQERHHHDHNEHHCPFRVERCIACGLLHIHNRKKLDCAETVVRCIHGCGREMRRKWIGDHETKACPKRKIACKWNCGEDIQADMYIDHVENQCECRLIECDWKCGNQVPVNELENHKLARCKRRFVWCPSGCGMKIRACDGKIHLERECANRQQKCRIGCKKVFPARDIEEHETRKCPLRMVPCGNGCGKSVEARYLAKHKEHECVKRLVPCEIGCDMVLPFDKLDDHHRLFCRRRKVLCPVGCGEEVIAQYTPGHMKSQCKLRFVKCTLNGGCSETFRECDREAHEKYNCSCRHKVSRKFSQ